MTPEPGDWVLYLPTRLDVPDVWFERAARPSLVQRIYSEPGVEPQVMCFRERSESLQGSEEWSAPISKVRVVRKAHYEDVAVPAAT